MADQSAVRKAAGKVGWSVVARAGLSVAALVGVMAVMKVDCLVASLAAALVA